MSYLLRRGRSWLLRDFFRFCNQLILLQILQESCLHLKMICSRQHTIGVSLHIFYDENFGLNIFQHFGHKFQLFILVLFLWAFQFDRCDTENRLWQLEQLMPLNHYWYILVGSLWALTEYYVHDTKRILFPVNNQLISSLNNSFFNLLAFSCVTTACASFFMIICTDCWVSWLKRKFHWLWLCLRTT